MKRVLDMDYGTGRIAHIEMDLVFELSIVEQIDYLREDMLQVEFSGGRCIVDAGWYPDGSEVGRFIVKVVKDYDWSSPIYREEASDLLKLRSSLVRAIEMAERYTELT
ncbi:hypothetical protein [Deinococcus arcticus]|uniref:hypothetical protein n=1 Tax=Deinococcus arcticus TaxID=2136176 RepID=UPI0011B1DDCF|nr:hypothetical protein [Deinococcus arcticus]